MTALGAPAVPRLGDDRCPGVLRLHPAQDGGLARIRLPGGRLSAAQLDAVAAGARLGNELVELTSRANLQVRGLDARAAARVEALLAEAGLLPSRTHERVRNVLASPLAGRHPRSLEPTDAVVDELDRGLRADPVLAALPGRFLFAVDDGAGLAGATAADVVLTAAAGGFRLTLGGRPSTLAAPAAAAAKLALAAAREFLTLQAEQDAWRVGDLDDGPARLAARLGGRIAPEAAGTGPATLSPGVLVQVDGRTAITALPPLGRLDPDALDGLAELARSHSGELRLSISRTLSLLDVDPAGASAVRDRLDRLGLVSSPRSGWQGLSACAGMGACTKALVDVRAAAAERAALRGPDDPTEHWAACGRRCGEPRDVGVAVFAGSDGLTRVEAGG